MMRRLRHTARGVVVHEGKILLMERWRPGKHYFSVPGGGIEPEETAEQTVEREIMEETTIKVRAVRPILEMRDGAIRHHIYWCEYLGGEPHLAPDAPEAGLGDDNRFEPKWVSIEQLPDLPLTYWEPLRQPLIKGLSQGFAIKPEIVTARALG